MAIFGLKFIDKALNNYSSGPININDIISKNNPNSTVFANFIFSKNGPTIIPVINWANVFIA